MDPQKNVVSEKDLNCSEVPVWKISAISGLHAGNNVINI